MGTRETGFVGRVPTVRVEDTRIPLPMSVQSLWERKGPRMFGFPRVQCISWRPHKQTFGRMEKVLMETPLLGQGTPPRLPRKDQKGL